VVADELRREHFGVLREAIEEGDGDEVKNTGDGLMVAFSGASAAIDTAVLMQQLMERRNRGA
jgi:class 3 adenylate cyclase